MKIYYFIFIKLFVIHAKESCESVVDFPWYNRVSLLVCQVELFVYCCFIYSLNIDT